MLIPFKGLVYYNITSLLSCSIDATRDNGRYGRLLNHGKATANVTTKIIVVHDEPYLCLLAARDIFIGEELLYDYGERNRGIIESHPWLRN